MSAIRPTEETLKNLIDLDLCSIIDDKYCYSETFTTNVTELQRKGLGRIKQMSIARKASSSMSTTILLYACFRNKRNIENLIAAYVCFLHHLDKVKKKVPKNKDNLVYAVWYLNDHEPCVEDV